MPPRTPPIFGTFLTPHGSLHYAHTLSRDANACLSGTLDKAWHVEPVSCCFCLLFMGVFIMLCSYWFLCRDGYLCKWGCDDVNEFVYKFKKWYDCVKWDLVEGEVYIGVNYYYFYKGKWKRKILGK